MTNDKIPDTEPQPDNSIDEDALRRRLINRIALAGVAIVALLGGLAIIDTMYVAPTPPKTKVEPPAPITAEAIKPPEERRAQEAPGHAAPEPARETPEPPRPEAVPSIRSDVPAEETSSPSAPMRQQRPLTRMPEVRQAISKPIAAPEPAPPAPTHAPASRPLSRAAQAERHYVLQMGVFNNLDNAQELLAKLQKNGIPAQIEARVRVGPFKTKAEAEEARTKLKAIGLDTGLLMPLHR